MKHILNKTLASLGNKYGVVWSILFDTEDDEVGYWIADIGTDVPDGEYTLVQSSIAERHKRNKGSWEDEYIFHDFVSTSKVTVKYGIFDVESVMKCTSECLKESGYHGYFIESLKLRDSGQLEVGIGS